MSEKVKKYLHGEQGFTLVEMMVVLVIIAVLIAGGVRYYMGYVTSSKITKARGDITTIQADLETYYNQNQSYPAADGTVTIDDSLGSAGLGPSLVSSSTDATITTPYVYIPASATPCSGYTVYTASAVDGSLTGFVVATGTSGTPGTIQTGQTKPS